ncbi:MAG: hypothetical protein ACRD5R_02845 [Candidatus Acidiferrales bacterium]
MKIRLVGILGILFIVLGLTGLMHPEIKISGKKQDVQLGTIHASMETSRIVAVPWAVSGIFILAGGVLVFMSSRNS